MTAVGTVHPPRTAAAVRVSAFVAVATCVLARWTSLAPYVGHDFLGRRNGIFSAKQSRPQAPARRAAASAPGPGRRQRGRVSSWVGTGVPVTHGGSHTRRLPDFPGCFPFPGCRARFSRSDLVCVEMFPGARVSGSRVSGSRARTSPKCKPLGQRGPSHGWLAPARPGVGHVLGTCFDSLPAPSAGLACSRLSVNIC